MIDKPTKKNNYDDINRNNYTKNKNSKNKNINNNINNKYNNNIQMILKMRIRTIVILYVLNEFFLNDF